MCGIAGIIDLQSRPVGEQELRRMTDAMQHRGPDGQGFYVHENIGFGHRRLAIIDLTDAGKQPMEYMGCTITYNGEIYNYLELREELRREGYQFHTNSDAEVILAAYQHWGGQFMHHLNGMWAFVIHDQHKKLLICSRDRFGEKPFYYCLADGRYIFCSSLAGIKAVLRSVPAVNRLMAARFLVFEQAEHLSDTFYQEIMKLPAAHNMVIELESGNIRLEKYYEPKKTDIWRHCGEQELAALLVAKLDRSVALRMRSDVPVGTCLSGGLDSSSIAAMAVTKFDSAVQHIFKGVTAGSTCKEKDERRFAQLAAVHFGIKWQTVAPVETDYQDAFERVLKAQEEPFSSPSVIMQYFVMDLAKKEGLKVLLDGQGADELLLGYLPHLAWVLQDIPLMQRWKAACQTLDHYRISLFQLFYLFFYQNNIRWKRKRQLWRWGHLPADLLGQLREELRREISLPEDLFSRQVHELTHGTLPMLLRYEDKNAMAFGVETRLPFLDPEVVELALNLPATERMKDGWSKHLLRKAMAPMLPREIAWREGKIGFDPGYPLTVAPAPEARFARELGLHWDRLADAQSRYRGMALERWLVGGY